MDEPTVSGLRGVFIFSGPDSIIEGKHFKGSYQDHVHLPSSDVIVRNNRQKARQDQGVDYASCVFCGGRCI